MTEILKHTEDPGGKLTQIPVGQRVIIIILIIVDVLPLLALPTLVLQRDSAGLVEARLDVLLAVRNGLVFFDVPLQNRRGGSHRRTRGRTATAWAPLPSAE